MTDQIITIYRKLFQLMLILSFWFTMGAVYSEEINSSPESDKYTEKDRIYLSNPGHEDDRLFRGSAEGVIQAPRDTVWTVLSDYNNYHKFFPRMPVTFIVDEGALKEIGKTQEWKRADFEALISKYRLEEPAGDIFYFYNVIDMTFPFADRWLLFRMERDPGQYNMYWKMIYGNMLITEGSWELEQYGRNSSETLAVYTTYSKSIIPIPVFIISIGLNNTLPDIIIGLRRRVSEFSFISERNK